MILVLLAALPSASVSAPTLVNAPRVVMQSPSGESQNRFQIGIILRSPERTLWDGSLWVSRRSGASWQQSVTEAVADQCIGARAYGGDRNETSVRLSVTSDEGDGSPIILAVNIRWMRPAQGPCDGTRAVEIQQNVRLDSAQPVVIRGDGGLTVEIRRR